MLWTGNLIKTGLMSTVEIIYLRAISEWDIQNLIETKGVYIDR